MALLSVDWILATVTSTTACTTTASESVYVVSLQAQNAHGQSPPFYKAIMTKKKTPEPDELYEPKDITVRVMSPQSVFVSWVDPPHEKQKNRDISSTRHYTIRYREKGESARWDYKHATQRRVLVDKLSSDNMYEFSVRISQGDRDGKWSVSVFQRTPESEKNVSRRPLRVKARTSEDSLSLRWRHPHLSGQTSSVAVRGYLLGVGESGRKMHNTPLQQDQRNHEIQKLASESVYVVSLQAQNAHGQSPPFYKAIMTKKKTPEPDELYEPKDITVRVMSPQSVFVSWVDPPHEKQKNRDISSTRHYTIRYREKGESARWDYKHATQRRVLVDKLSSDNMYEFSVRISQGDRDGKWSVSVFQRTPESAPTGSPENFEVQPLKGKGTSVTATWEPPADTDGKIREYILSYAPALKPFGAKSITYRGDTTSAIIEGLQPGDRYIFKIRAANRRGQGPQSKAFSVNMPTTSTVASTSHQQSKNSDFSKNDQSSESPSRTSLSSSSKLPSSHSTSNIQKRPASKTPNRFSHEALSDRSELETDLQSTEEPDESELHPSEPVPPSPSKATTFNSRRKTRPLSQTRSYHSIFSSIRSPVRIGQSAIKQRPDTTTSSPHFKDNETKDLSGRQHTSSSRQTDLNEDLEEELDEDTEEKHEEVVRQKNPVHSKAKDDGHSDFANKKHSSFVPDKSQNHKTGSSSKVPETSSGSSQPKFSRTSGNRSVISVQKPHMFPNSETSKPRRPISFSNRKSVSPSLVTHSSSSESSSGMEIESMVTALIEIYWVAALVIEEVLKLRVNASSSLPSLHSSRQPIQGTRARYPGRADIATREKRPGTFVKPSYEQEAQTTLLPTTEAPTTEPEEGYPETRPFNSSPSSEFDIAGKRRFTAPYVNFIRKDPGAPCSLTEALEYLQVDILEDLFSKDSKNQPPKNKPHNITVVAMEGCHSFIILDWARPVKGDAVSGYMVHSASYDDILNNRWSTKNSSGTHLPVENLKPNSRSTLLYQKQREIAYPTRMTPGPDPGGEPIWIPFSFKYASISSECNGSQYVKRTWYRKFVGVVLCNSLRYKIFMGDGLKDTFYSIGDTYGRGEDHCQFVDSHMEGRTGPRYTSDSLPTIPGFYRANRQEPVHFGLIGSRTSHYYVGWYECGVPIPGKW
ncbi:UNVERIFIED_CONTAM: hypothetical protein FKN15_041157 [Acipenser sinensis]